MPPAAPDPKSDLFSLVERGGGATAEAVMLRVLWLRQDHPEATVATDVVRADDAHVVIRAQVAVPGGASGSGIAAARVHGDDDWAAAVERTETMAIARALDTLGYVVRHGGRSDSLQESVAEADAAEDVATRETVSPPEEPGEPESRQPDQRPDQNGPRVAETAPPVVSALRRANRRPEAAPDPEPEPSQDADAHLEEYSWSAFWGRARSLGLTPDKVTQILGQPAAQMSPREAVAGLIEAGAWPESGE